MKIAILGTGAFGMAVASICHNNNQKIKMWTNSEEEKELLSTKRKSNKIEYDIPEDIIISTDLEDVVKDTDIIFFVIPAEFTSKVSNDLKKYYKKEQTICIASKGIEQNTCLFLYDIVRNNLNTDKIAIISGGTFAIDIANKSPVGFSLASRSKKAKS